MKVFEGANIRNVAVMVQDWPTSMQLGGRSGTLLGLYEGIDLTHRSPIGYTGVMPDRITIFRGPLERYFETLAASGRRLDPALGRQRFRNSKLEV